MIDALLISCVFVAGLVIGAFKGWEIGEGHLHWDIVKKPRRG
jgi:hypothetical protein